MASHLDKAWHRIPEITPYGTARAMIEAEVCENYDAFVSFVGEIIGVEYAAMLADNHADRPGPANVNDRTRNTAGQFLPNPTPNVYTHKHLGKDKQPAKGGTGKAYLLERIAAIAPEVPAMIGKGKTYKTVFAAARAVGVVEDRKRVCVYEDNPQAAGKLLAKHVDDDWMIACYEAFMQASETS